MSRSFSAAAQTEGHMTANVFQPLHISDFVDAIKRVMESGEQYIYNVCGQAEVSAERLYQMICWRAEIQERDVQWEKPSCVILADSDRIRSELGWNDFRNLEDQMRKGEIIYERAPAKSRKKKKWTIPTDIRQMAENLLLFEVFFLLTSLCSSNGLTSQINWLMIYVILIAISYNIYQSALAALLASAAYLYGQHLSLLEITTFSSYVDAVLAFVQFVSLGLMVSYTTNLLRMEAWSVRLDLDMLREEYEDLKAINEENVLIKMNMRSVF